MVGPSAVFSRKKQLVLLSFAMSTLFTAASWAADDGEDVREQLNVLKDEILILQDQLEEYRKALSTCLEAKNYSVK